MNTYHFVNEPTDRSDINRILQRLEQVIANSFTRQVKKSAENDDSAMITNNYAIANNL